MANNDLRTLPIYDVSGLPAAAAGMGVYPALPAVAPVPTHRMGMAMQTLVWTDALSMQDCHRIVLTQTAVAGLWGARDEALMATPIGLSLMRVVSNGFSAYGEVDMDSSGSMATMALQMAGAFVPEAQIASPELAAAWIQRIGMVLLANFKTCCTSMYPGISSAWATARAAGQEGVQPGILHGLEFNSDDDSAAFPLNFTSGNQPSLEAAVAFIHFVADMIKNESSASMSVLVGSVIALTKRGNITRPKLRSVTSELSKATSRELQFNLQDIKHIYEVVGRNITKENARDYFEAIQAMCGMENGMRLTLMAQQASLAGLTQITCIRTAITNHSNFPWVRLYEMWPSQMAAVQNALTAIRNNPFYGFDANLGQVKSTLYKDVFVVAKKLLIKIDGASTLSNYEGGKTTCANSEEVETMIERYVQHYGAPPQGEYSADIKQKTADLLASAAGSDQLAMDVQA